MERWPVTGRSGPSCLSPGAVADAGPPRLRIAASDLLACRVVISPLSALLMPMFVTGNPGVGGPRPWLESARRASAESTLVLRAMLDAVPCGAALGLLVAPLPHARPSLADQVGALARLPGSAIAQTLRSAAAGKGSDLARSALRMDLSRLAPTLARETDRLWRAAFAPEWERIRPALDDETSRLSADVLRLGLGPTLSRTLPAVRFGVTQPRPPGDSGDLPGLLLLPVVGADGPVVSRSPAGPVLVHYPIEMTSRNADAESRVFGRTRAKLLTHLATPHSTSALAGQLGLSTATVSYHLLRLYRGGMLERSREGHEVLYRLSTRGRNLLDHPPPTNR